MRRPLLMLVAMAAVLILVVACNGDDADGTATPSPTTTGTPTASPTSTPTSTPTATETPDGKGPPEVTATATAAGGSIVLGEGTYCWALGSGSPGLCADKIGVITPTRALSIAEGETIELRGDLDWRNATFLAVSAIPRPAGPVDSGPDWLAYRPEGDATDVPFEQTSDGIRLSLPLVPGDWLLTLSIAEERGDATYGLLVHQTPSPTGAFRTHLGLETEMAFGAEYLVEGTPYTVVVTSIEEDSRCPVDVTCVWAGQTRLIVEARANGSVTPLGLTVPNGGEVTGVIDSTYQVRIVDVRPEPRSTVQLEPGDYIIAVVVERTDAASTGTGVRGVVSVGPICPVQRDGVWCPDRPLAAELVVRDDGGDEIERVEASEDGWFELELAPGSYVLDPQTPAGSPFPIGQPQDFTVVAGGWTSLEVSYDSGIR